MRKRFPTNYILLYIFFAVVILSALYIVYGGNKKIPCNKFIIGIAMEMRNNEIKSDYEILLDELNNKYFEKVCDIFDHAKAELLTEVKELLGERYAVLNEEIKSLKQEIIKKRENFDNEQQSIELKDRLQVAKSKFVEAETEEDKEKYKKELNAVLSEVAKRNLVVFSEMSEIRKKIDQKCFEAIDIVKTKEQQFKDIEKTIVTAARKKTLELAVSYKSEVSALALAFDIKTYSVEMPFLKSFNPEMRLIDFDKNAFMEAFYSRTESCGVGCSGNCASCTGAKSDNDNDKNFFKSDPKNGFCN